MCLEEVELFLASEESFYGVTPQMEETSRVSQQMMRAFFTKTKLLGSLGFARFSKLLQPYAAFFPLLLQLESTLSRIPSTQKMSKRTREDKVLRLF